VFKWEEVSESKEGSMLFENDQRIGNKKNSTDSGVIIREMKEDTSKSFLTLDISEAKRDLSKVFPTTKKNKKKIKITD
jgi:hypothetical protein